MGRSLLYFLLGVLAALAFPRVVAATETVRVDLAASHTDLSAATLLLEDPAGTLTFADVRGAGSFKPGSPSIGVSPSAFWIRITLQNPSANPATYWFDTGNRTLQEVDLYWPDAQGRYRHVSTGSTKRFAERPLQTSTFVFPLELPASQTIHVFLRVRSTGYLGAIVRPMLWQPDAFRLNARNEETTFFLLLGIALALGLFNLMLGLYNRDVNNLFYIMSLAAWTFGMCSSLGGYGTAFERFWPNAPVFEQTAWVASIFAALIFPTAFIIRLLELPKSNPVTTRVIFWSIVVSAVPIGFQLVVTALQLPGQGAALQKAYALGTLPFGVAYLATIWGIVSAILGGNRTAKFVAVAFFPILILTLHAAYQTQAEGFLRMEPLMLAGSFESIVMSLAIADRFYQLRLEKRAAQHALLQGLQQSERELEAKVAQRTLELQLEQARTKELLHNILPAELAEELSTTGRARPARHESVSILFTDFSGFTNVVATVPPDRMVAELNEIFAAFDDIADECGVEKIKTIGDAYMAVAGLPKSCADHAQRCVRMSLRMLDYLKWRNQSAAFKWSLRVGVHSGPVVAGVVGKRKYAFDIWGDTVNVAARMESSGGIGKVNVSAYTYDLIRGEFNCEYRGKVEAKGKGEIDMYFVEPPAESATQSNG